MSMEPTQKVCTNGHRMEPDWEVCPYCPSNRTDDPALARTMKVEATRLEGGNGGAPAPAAAPAPGAAPEARRTQVIQRDPAPAGVAWLVAATGPGRGRSHAFRGERALVGASSACDVTLEGEHISERHASLRFQEGGYLVTDLDSTNGTFVNGERIQQQALEDGDRVGLGSSEWIFKCVVFDAD